MKKTVHVGIIGLGARAETLLATIFCFDRSDVLVTAICDVNAERIDRIRAIMKEHDYPAPEVFFD